MAVNFAQLVYLPTYQAFARPVIITPVASQPGAAAYPARGIFDTNESDIEALEGSRFSETETILDILEFEFPVLPMQGDVITIPYHEMIRGGTYVVTDKSADGNAGGETTLYLRKVEVPRIVGNALILQRPWFGRPRLSVREIRVRGLGFVLTPSVFERPLLAFANAVLPVDDLMLAAPVFERPALAVEAGLVASGFDLLAPDFEQRQLGVMVILDPSGFTPGNVATDLTAAFVVPPAHAIGTAQVNSSSDFEVGQIVYVHPLGWFEIIDKG